MKQIFITGASAGIGLAIAKALCDRGDEVWGTSRNPTRLAELPRLHPVQLNLADPDSIERAFHQALSEAGHFDVVVNNAGSGHFGPAESLSLARVAEQFQVLVLGQIQLMQLALRAMRGHEKGLIVNVTSLASRLPVPFMAAYNAGKAAMASFTMSVQLELPDSRVRIVDLEPGDISTGFNDAMIKNVAADPRYDARVAKTWGAVERSEERRVGKECRSRWSPYH